MKLELKGTPVDSSTTFEEQEFSIGNVALIIEILRSKMYSDSIHTTCQEIMTNARDAHREMGKSDIPIEVKVPNQLEPFWAVRDFGPGITPERMSNVFIRYGVSTKRDSNEQTGGFGLGAKSPWAYVDTFSITSITPDEDGQLIKREYVCYVDEKRVGKLAKVLEEPTDEPQGTTITVAVKPNDFGNFSRWTHEVGQYWEVLPVIKGVADFEWNINPILIKGKDWAVYERGLSYGSHPFALVDGIAYTVDMNILMNYEEQHAKQFRGVGNVNVGLSFNTGDIGLTANREEIDYTDATKEMLKKKLASFHEEFTKQITVDVTKATSLWEAGCLFAKVMKNYSGFVDDIDWNGIKVSNFLTVPDSFMCYVYKRSGFGKKRHETSNIEYDDDYLLCIDDTVRKFPDYRRIETLFDTYPQKMNIYVLVYPRGKDKDTLKSNQEAMEKSHLDMVDMVKMSTVARKLKPKATNGSGQTYVAAKGYILDNYRWDPKELDVEDGEGYYVEMVWGKPVRKDGNQISSSVLQAVIQHWKIKNLCGFPSRFVSKLGDGWVRLEGFVADNISDLEKDADFINWWQMSQDDNIEACPTTNILYEMAKKHKNIRDQLGEDHPILVAGAAYEQYNKISDQCQHWNEIFTLVHKALPAVQKSKGVNIQSLLKQLRKRYPLIYEGLSYSYRLNDVKDDVFFYIFAKDKEAEK